MKIYYNPKLKEKAGYLRNNSTLSEVLLWQNLKGKQMRGFDFHRQKPIDNYIVDFFCPKLILAIEIDGGTHSDKEKYDQNRQKKLENLGINFLRFSDYNVKKSINGILDEIEEWIVKHTPSPS